MPARELKKIVVSLFIPLVFFVLLGSSLADDKPRGGQLPFIIATDYPSINAAVEAARKQNINRVFIPAGEYDITKTINMTGRYGRNGAIILEGAGQTTILNGKTGKDPIIDLTASGYCEVNNLYINSINSDIGILMARRGGGSAGSHRFHSLTLHGKFRIAAVYSYNSECNRFYNCNICNEWDGEEGGDAFIFTHENIWNVKSPYLGELGRSTNTELDLYGTIIGGTGPNSVGLRIVGSADNINIYGGYQHYNGFAAIYLDGTRGAVSNIYIDGWRIETTEGKHCIYATGQVDNITIRGGEWSSARELIRVEDVPREANSAHATLFRRKSRFGVPFNWRIRETTMLRTIWVPEGKKREMESAAEKFVAMRFDSLQDSTIENITYRANFLEQEGPNWIGRAVPNASLVVVEKYSRRNTFIVPARNAVELMGDARGNQIAAVHDPEEPDGEHVALWRSALPNKEHFTGFMRRVSQYEQLPPGVRRIYIKPDEGISLINLGVMDVRKIKGARRGDIAIHNGAGFDDGEARLAIFDGKKWIYFAKVAGPSGD